MDSSDEPQNDKEDEGEQEYDISKLEVWENIEWLELTEKSDEAIYDRPARSFTFAGEKELTWKLYGYHDKIYDQDNISFVSDTQKLLKIPFSNTIDTTTLFDSSILNTDSIDVETQRKLLAGETIRVKLTITMYRYVGFEKSEKIVDMKVDNVVILEKESEKESEKKEKITMKASGFEPSWTISIDWNTLTYSSPELFSDENTTGRIDFHLNVLENKGKNIFFEWEYISWKFIKKDCVTEWLGDTVPYTVEYTYEWREFTNWCGE